MFLLFLGLLITALVLAKQGRLGPPPWVRARHQPDASAVTILAERLARGEIDADDYRDRMAVLREQRERPDDGTLR